MTNNVNRVSVVEFASKEANSLSRAALNTLADQITEAGKSDSRAILIQSSGEKAFCAGASFSELKQLKDVEDATDFFMGFARVMLALIRSPKITVARVQGRVVGGGVGIVAACDYSVAASSASIRLSEVALGFGPFVIGPVVNRKIGAGHFSALAVGTEWKDASWGANVGLFSEVVETSSKLDERVAELLSRFGQYNSEGVTTFKKTLWRGSEGWDAIFEQRAREVGRLVLSENCQRLIHAI